MIFKINEDIIEKTIKCTKGHSCIKDKAYNLCKVIRDVNSEVHFIECMDTNQCSYRFPFGNADICSCPVRKEIYNKYKV